MRNECRIQINGCAEVCRLHGPLRGLLPQRRATLRQDDADRSCPPAHIEGRSRTDLDGPREYGLRDDFDLTLSKIGCPRVMRTTRSRQADASHPEVCRSSERKVAETKALAERVVTNRAISRPCARSKWLSIKPPRSTQMPRAADQAVRGASAASAGSRISVDDAICDPA